MEHSTETPNMADPKNSASLGSSVAPCYARPRTRGDLRDLLNRGVSCEVASHVAEMTEIILKGWLNFDPFTVRPSENKGWVVFEA